MTPIPAEELPPIEVRRRLLFLQRIFFTLAIGFTIAFGGGILRAALYHVLDNRAFDARLATTSSAAGQASGGEVAAAGVASAHSARSTGPIAKLEIPRIGLSVIVRDGTDAWTLNRGVGHIAGTSYPGSSGNIGIAGHRDGFFRGLRKVHPRDEILLTSPDGSVDRYLIDEVRVVSPSDISVLDDRKTPSVTLVTCYPFSFIGPAPQRYVLSASRVSSTGSRPDVPAS